MEFVHILTPPADGGRTVQLPPPADGKKFARAVLLANRKPAGILPGCQRRQAHASGRRKLEPAAHRLRPQGRTRLAGTKPGAVESLPRLVVPRSGSEAKGHGLGLCRRGRRSRHGMAIAPGRPAARWRHGVAAGHPAALPNRSRPARRPQPASRCRRYRPRCRRCLSPESAAFANAAPVAVSKDDARTDDKLEIQRATYGSRRPNRRRDGKTARASAAVRPLTSWPATNLAGCDPAPNKPKELRVEYTLNGTAATATVAENQTLTLGTTPVWKIELPAGPAPGSSASPARRTATPVHRRTARIWEVCALATLAKGSD